MIKLRGVTKLYKDFAAVKDLDLDVDKGEILGIIGHNGAGKSTTLKMMVGLVSPTSGSVEVMGRDMAKDALHVKRFLGYLPEDSPLYENMTVSEYLRFFSELYGMPSKKADERIGLLLGSLKLPERNKLTGELSKGMKRKVSIARALLHDPDILVLDEPSSGLDPLTSFFIVDYLRRLRAEGKTIVLSAHNLFHVEYVCDRVAILKNGKLLVCDSMANIRKSLGKREYEVKFMSGQRLDYEKEDGHYILRTADLGEVAAILRDISENDWALVDLSMRESALEDIYVRLMAE
ncbi:ABC-type multidrug transport system, ATPase component [Methanocella conradii HZ254]|uniref:ABC-type multidrug transport system, ATPase component n=1 Tax=Methanocella conradii (strain DSM 24694 / JCM 17849 / CGMCC 1.5162 / HZ254) TaxID=1041930 RepID=H8I9D7_METCZ|nr:ABC transporter ATP-binding protein [Methanocella conradii]AFC99555.1 ABC-type multidrug transport system, ATPase component [Methanocella conradii HZ254]